MQQGRDSDPVARLRGMDFFFGPNHRNADGTYFDAQAANVPFHVVTVAPLVTGDRVNVHSVPAPVFCDTPAIAPVATERLATYFVAVVLQPAAVASAGRLFFVDRYSLTEVLQAAIAASVSDIFERTT